jgi:hypothetical protein
LACFCSLYQISFLLATQPVHTLGISKAGLHHWISLGLLQARQFDEPLHRWVIWADEAELERLRQYHQRNVGEDFHHRWTGEALEKQS